MSATDVSASTTIAAPPATIFAIVADARQHARIDGSGTVRDAVDAPERLELGSTFGMRMKIGAPYRTKNKVVEYDADGNLIYRINDGCMIVNGLIACKLGKARINDHMFDNMREYFDEQRLPQTDEGNGTEPEALRPAN